MCSSDLLPAAALLRPVAMLLLLLLAVAALPSVEIGRASCRERV